jgi:hypothetical protein
VIGGKAANTDIVGVIDNVGNSVTAMVCSTVGLGEGPALFGLGETGGVGETEGLRVTEVLDKSEGWGDSVTALVSSTVGLGEDSELLGLEETDGIGEIGDITRGTEGLDETEG